MASMASEVLYRIVDSGVRGMFAVATRDIMPGELIVEEKEPLLSISQTDLQRYKCKYPDIEFALAGHSAFAQNLTPEKRRRFLSLYSPVTGTVPDNLRQLLQVQTELRCGADGQIKTFTPIEIKMIVRVFQTFRLNMFGDEKVGYRVYSEITRFSHSCASNCQYSIVGQSIVCYARCSISSGEELTISYSSLRYMDPIYERRRKYFETKDFTCHCPRCDAPGDDTRQFDCFNPACKGVMMVCQPVSKDNFTDVEYVEPHLLPCTVCLCTAPADYQTEMLILEKNLLELGPHTALRFASLVEQRKHKEMEPLYQELLRMKIPSRHAASLPLLKARWNVLHYQYLDSGPRVVTALQEAVMAYVTALEAICTYPGDFLCAELTNVVAHCSKICFRPVFPPLMEKILCLRVLRMHLLLLGRSTRNYILDDVTARCHERLPTTGFAELCAFCEESPLRAALTLSRCGQCRLVVYCSAECQRVHWKVHKKTCKLAVGWK